MNLPKNIVPKAKQELEKLLNGNKNFMYGISTVMEWIAYRVSEKQGEEFSAMFLDNMIDSQEKVSDKE